eukprot:m.13053 g.13053  ORF g.13053 m.13053 type:complete len:158 (+) comp10087_c0_seq1:35-508(+)
MADVHIDLQEGQAPSQTVHFLPCQIQHDGKAPIQQYFNPVIEEEAGVAGPAASAGTVYKATLRGRWLRGSTLPMQSGCKGVILQSVHKVENDQTDSHYHAKYSFKEVTCWNLETTPSDADSMVQAMLWPNTAQEIHAPLSSEQVATLADSVRKELLA